MSAYDANPCEGLCLFYSKILALSPKGLSNVLLN